MPIQLIGRFHSKRKNDTKWKQSRWWWILWTESLVVFDTVDSLRSPDKTSVIGAMGSPLLFRLLRFWGTADGYCWVRVNILTPWNILFRKLFDWKKMPWLTSEVYLSFYLICDRIDIAVKAEFIMHVGAVYMQMRSISR